MIIHRKTFSLIRKFSLMGPLLVPLVLAACVDTTPDYRENNQIQVNRQPFNLVVRLPEQGQAINDQDLVRMQNYVDTFLKRGEGLVAVSLPPMPNEEMARSSAATMSRALLDMGLKAGELDLRTPDINNESTSLSAAAMLSFMGYVAEVPQCGDWSENFAMEYWNGPRDAFGCATQRNIGLMVSNPRDLIQKRQTQGRDGERSRDVQLKYQTGVDTRSKPAVSSAISKQSQGVTQ